jgi:hypothetical protein
VPRSCGLSSQPPGCPDAPRQCPPTAEATGRGAHYSVPYQESQELAGLLQPQPSGTDVMG